MPCRGVFNGTVLRTGVGESFEFHGGFESNLVLAAFPFAVMVLEAGVVTQPRQIDVVQGSVTQQLPFVKFPPTHEDCPAGLGVDPIFKCFNGLVKKRGAVDVGLGDAGQLRAKF